MSKGKSVAGFVLGVVTALCGIAVVVLSAVGMHSGRDVDYYG